MVTRFTRAKLVLAGLGLVLSNSADGNLSAQSAQAAEQSEFASVAGLPKNLPAGWKRSGCSEASGAQILTLSHCAGERICFLRCDSRISDGTQLLQEILKPLDFDLEERSSRSVGGREMMYVKGSGLWFPGEKERIGQLQGCIVIPEQNSAIQISAIDIRRMDTRLRSTDVLLHSIKRIPV
jgi:hypothetical protein